MYAQIALLPLLFLNTNICKKKVFKYQSIYYKSALHTVIEQTFVLVKLLTSGYWVDYLSSDIASIKLILLH